MKKTIRFFALFTVAAILVPFTGFCQDPVAVLETPQDFIAPSNVNALTIGLTVLLGYIARFIPGASKLKGYVKAGAAGIVTLAGFATFKFGFLSQDTFTFIVAAFLPNFAFAGLTWETLKFILGLLKVSLPGIAPKTQQ